MVYDGVKEELRKVNDHLEEARYMYIKRERERDSRRQLICEAVSGLRFEEPEKKYQ